MNLGTHNKFRGLLVTILAFFLVLIVSSINITLASDSGQGCITVLKETFDSSGNSITPVSQFTFRLGNDRTATNDASGLARFDNVVIGSHQVTETVPSGWSQISVTPQNGFVQVLGGAICSAVIFKNKQTPPTPPPPPPPPPPPSLSAVSLSINKQVRNISSSSGIGDLVSAKIADRVEFRITVTNLGNGVAQNVRLYDILPSYLSFVSGTIRLDGSTSFSGDLFNNNISLGSLSPNQNRSVNFEATVNSNFSGNLINTATAFADNASSVQDTATVFSQIAGTDVDLILSKKAFNMTKNQDATGSIAQPNDLILYTLTVENRGNAIATNYIFEENLTDVLELSNLVDFAPASFDLAKYTLKWPAVSIPPQSKLERTFSVRVRPNLPENSDFVMTNVFGNVVNVPLKRPEVKGVFIAPKTGNSFLLSLIFSSLVMLGLTIYRKRAKISSYIKLII